MDIIGVMGSSMVEMMISGGRRIIFFLHFRTVILFLCCLLRGIWLVLWCRISVCRSIGSIVL